MKTKKPTKKREHIITVTDATFEVKVLKRHVVVGGELVRDERPVLVDFHATWCGPCEVMGKILEAIEPKLRGKVVFAKLNTEYNEEVTKKYDVRMLPTLLLFRNGAVVKRLVGLQGKALMLAILEA